MVNNTAFESYLIRIIVHGGLCQMCCKLSYVDQI